MTMATRPTHVVQTNGSGRGPLIDTIRPYPEAIRFSLNRMNGTSSWAYGLWRAPAGTDLLEELPFTEEYLQCAGSAEALTIEVRILDPDGTAHQYTVGKPDGDSTAEPKEVIRWDSDRSGTTVHPHEVFTADEAADIFYAYFLTDRVAPPYVLRELDLTWPPTEEGGQADQTQADDSVEQIQIEVERLDAHPADQGDRTTSAEVPPRFLLSDLLTRVLEPFLDVAPRTTWVCRGLSRGHWREFAEVVTFGAADRLGLDLLVRDQTVRDFVGDSATTFRIICRPRTPSPDGTRSGPGQPMASRALSFGDDLDNERQWEPGATESAREAFWEFVGEHYAEGNLTFYVEDEEKSEGLGLLIEADTIARIKQEPEQHIEYRAVSGLGEYRIQVSTFIHGGFTALDRYGPWLPDIASLDSARLRLAFGDSVLRRTHPRELRRRLEILTQIDGRQPTTRDEITHYGFGTPGGDAVNAWFAANGRALVVTFDHKSILNSANDPHAQAELYDGVPDDLLALARNVPPTGTVRQVPHPDGGSQVAATGIFHLSGPCALAEGVVSRMTRVQAEQLAIKDTGVDWLLQAFLAPEDFTPAVVAELVDWWSAEDIANGFATVATDEPEQAPASSLPRKAVERFRWLWAATGYNDPTGVHHVFFDSCSLEGAGDARYELLSLISTLGLEQVDNPPGASEGEVWVRTDPRIDVEREDLVDSQGDAGLLETGIRALSYPWSDADLETFRSLPYPLPAGLIPLIERLEAELPADHDQLRTGLQAATTYVPSSARRGAYVPLSAGGGARVMARKGLPRVLLDLLLHGVITPTEGAQLVKAAERTDLPAGDRDLVVRDLQLRLIEVHLMAGDFAAAEQLATGMAPEWQSTGWREVAACRAANGDAAGFFRNWSCYDAGRDRADMQRLKTKLVHGVALREGWQAAVEVCGDRRIGDGFLSHAFEPPAYGYDDLEVLFGGDAAGVLTEADELHCLVAAAAAEPRPRPLDDHRGVEDLLSRIGALDPLESKDAMRTRDGLLRTLYVAVGSEDTLARLRALLRSPQLRRQTMRLFVGPDGSQPGES